MLIPFLVFLGVNKIDTKSPNLKHKTMKQPLVLLMILVSTLTAPAQSSPKDSLYFVRLRDNTTLYSNKVKLVDSRSQGKYLLLDNNQKIPLSEAKEFKGWQGTFAIGQIGGRYDAFKLQNEGRKISLYSQCYYTTDTYYNATTPDGVETPTTITSREKAYYFRKGTDSNIQRVTYHNLKLALADNPSSMHQLRIAGTNLYLGIGLLAGGLAVTAAGIIETGKRNNDAQNAFKTASANWLIQAQTNPNASPPALVHHSESPLIYIGAATTLSAMIPLFNVGRHAQKALEIYNGID
jgi:opacity protein-like surface antigen